MSRPGCEALQFGDQWQCGRCGLAWDVGDSDPPKCGRTIDKRAIPDRKVTNEIKRMVAAQPADDLFSIVSTTPAPEALLLLDPVAPVSGAVLAGMQHAYEQFIVVHGRTCSRNQAMRAALQVYLDSLAR